MSSDFKILGSSSSGNCALLRTGNSKILIDAGFSGKRIGLMLETVGESIDSIDAVFLTHEHNDHAQGVRGLSKRTDLPVFANRDTADAVQGKLVKKVNWQVFQTGTGFKFRDIEVRSFSVPHDAYDPVGFTFHWGEVDDLISPPQSLAWVTDLGHIPEHIKQHIKSVQILVLEANYDKVLLDSDTRRPWSLKQRIRGRHGHLSNDACLEALIALNGSSEVREVYLAHLSKDCNTVELVQNKFAPLTGGTSSFTINVVDPKIDAALAAKS